MKKKILAIFILLSFCVYADYPILQSSKSGSLIKMAYTDSYLLALYDNGTLDIVDGNTSSIVNSIQLITTNVTDMIVHPTRKEVVIVSHIEDYTIQSISYQTGKTIAQTSVGTRPFFVNYSKMGKYILYSNSTSNGLILLDSLSLMQVKYINTQTIVYYATTNTKESILMYYTPTRGYIRYYDISKNNYVLNLEIEKGFEKMAVLKSKSKIILGIKGDEISAIDNTNGKVYDKLKIPNLSSIELSQNDDIGVLSSNGRSSTIFQYAISDDYKFVKKFDSKTNTSVSAFCYSTMNDTIYNTVLYYGDNNGYVYKYDEQNQSGNRLYENYQNPVYSISVHDGFLIASAKNGLYKIDVATSDNRLDNVSISKVSQISGFYIVKIDNNTIILYKKNNFKIFDLRTMKETKSVDVDNDIRFLNYDNEKIFVATLQKSYSYNAKSFEMSQLGFSNVYSIMDFNGTLTLSLSKQNPLKTPIVQISTKNENPPNAKTETVETTTSEADDQTDGQNIPNPQKRPPQKTPQIGSKRIPGTINIKQEIPKGSIPITQFKNDEIVKVYKDKIREMIYIISKDIGSDGLGEQSHLRKLLPDFSTVFIDTVVDSGKDFVDFVSDEFTDFLFWCDVAKIKKFNGYYFINKTNRKIPTQVLTDANFLYVLNSDGSIEFLSKWSLNSLFEIDLIQYKSESGFALLSPNSSYYSTMNMQFVTPKQGNNLTQMSFPIDY